MESIIDENVDPADLKKFEKVYTDQLNRGQPSSKAQFEYAWCLVRSSKSNDIKLGIAMLEDLLSKDDDDMAKRDYLYYLAVGHLRQKNYDKSISYINALIRVEPGNAQATELKRIAEKRMQRDGYIGAAILGGAALAGGALLVGAIAALSRKSS